MNGRAGKVAQCLRASAALSENPNSVPVPGSSQSPVTTASGYLTISSGMQDHMHPERTHTHSHTETHIHNQVCLTLLICMCPELTSWNQTTNVRACPWKRLTIPLSIGIDNLQLFIQEQEHAEFFLFILPCQLVVSLNYFCLSTYDIESTWVHSVPSVGNLNLSCWSTDSQRFPK